MPKQVFLATRDLVFRSKLARVVVAAGAEVTRDEAACELAVLEIEPAGLTDRINRLVACGTAVLAYGSHVRADLLRTAREAGATAVPNSQVEEKLQELLGAADPGPPARGQSTD
ncbi:MAG TPA: hypothetical protein VEK85_12320 [Gemmatimonadales bacterium]|nr:hypothetical protein [Gemmatimonadales bacterium]